MKSVYFAHPLTHYNTNIEYDCIEIMFYMLVPVGENLEEYMMEIMNPNQEWLARLYESRKKLGDGNAFEIFKEIVRSCDIVVGSSCLDGSISAGVAEEMNEGLKCGKEVFLILFDKGRKMFLPYMGSGIYNVLSIEETRNRIKEGVM